MAKPTLKEEIETLRTKFAEEQKAAQKAFEEKVSALLGNVKKAVLHSLHEAQTNLDGLDEDEQMRVLNDGEIKKIFTSFGYKRKEAGSGDSASTASTGKGGRFDEEKILKFLADGPKEQSLVQAHCNTSKQSIGNWGKKLVEAGKIEIKKNGREKFWSKL